MAKKDKILSIEETLWDSGIVHIFRTVDRTCIMKGGNQ